MIVQVAMETKQGRSNLELVCEELLQEEQAKEQKREMKRQKKKKKKNNNKASTPPPDKKASSTSSSPLTTKPNGVSPAAPQSPEKESKVSCFVFGCHTKTLRGMCSRLSCIWYG